MSDPWQRFHVPLDTWIQTFVDSAMPTIRPVFQAIKLPLQVALDGSQAILVSAPPWLVLVSVFLLAWQLAGIRIAAFVLLAFVSLGLIGVWQATMLTLAVVVTAVVICVVIGIPVGIVCARSDRVESGLRPVLDVMQTLPAFVYMVPTVMLFGIGNVSGVAVTSVFALPPVIRLTSLGLRNVPASMVEAAYAFGSSPRHVLWKIQFPLASRTIMAGVNQTLMMALAMVVIASMISVDGLGMLVLRGIGRLDVGLATIGGIGIVLVAMVLDRLTQGMGARSGVHGRLRDRGPAGLLRRLAGAGGSKAGDTGSTGSQ